MKKYKVGYTTGVFDLFHIGHLNLLKHAKEKCDYLIVGVSTDELVSEYKNKTPVIPFSQRIEIVNSIKYVDETLPQETMDKFAQWKKIHYDVLLHGDDWKNSDMYNDIEEKLNAVGVEVVFLPHTDGISSTDISTRLRR